MTSCLGGVIDLLYLSYWLKQDALNIAVILYEDGLSSPNVDMDAMSINIESRVAFLVSAYLAYSGETKDAREGLDRVVELVGQACCLTYEAASDLSAARSEATSRASSYLRCLCETMTKSHHGCGI